jgi:hypothetical protein
VSPELRALFLAAPGKQGGHSAEGAMIAERLGLPFPLTMADLVAKVRAEGENPAAMYPWLIKMGRPHDPAEPHRYFTQVEIAAAGRKAPLNDPAPSSAKEEP